MQGQMYSAYIETSGQAPDSVAGRAAWQAQLDTSCTRQARRWKRSAGGAEVALRDRTSSWPPSRRRRARSALFAPTFRFTRRRRR